jgi:hypothetical protein
MHRPHRSEAPRPDTTGKKLGVLFAVPHFRKKVLSHGTNTVRKNTEV